MAVLAGDLEGDVVGGVALDLERAGGQVVEVLVQQLKRRGKKQCQPNRRIKQFSSVENQENCKETALDSPPKSNPKERCLGGHSSAIGRFLPSLLERVDKRSESKTHVVGRLGNVREVGDRHRDCRFGGMLLG